MSVCSLIEMDLRDVEGINDWACLTDGPFDVEYNGKTFHAFGSVLKIDPVSVENSLSNKAMKITLSGIDEQFMKLVSSSKFRQKPVTVYKVLVPDETNKVSDAEVYYRGLSDSPEISVDYDSGKWICAVSCKSLFDLSQKPSLSRSNASTWETYHPGDLFFSYANQNENRADEMWRRS